MIEREIVLAGISHRDAGLTARGGRMFGEPSPGRVRRRS